MTAPGCYLRDPRGALFIGQYGVHEVTPRLTALEALLSLAAPTTISTNIEGVLWAKLAWNCAVSGLCAVSGRVLGEVVGTPQVALLLAVYGEALDTAAAHGIVLETIVIDRRASICRSMRVPRCAPNAWRPWRASPNAMARSAFGPAESATRAQHRDTVLERLPRRARRGPRVPGAAEQRAGHVHRRHRT